MPIQRNSLYTILIIACLAGYIWLYIALSNETETVNACVFKFISNNPCPSCGTTRSVIQIIQGQFMEALLLNPIGYIVFFILLICPIWIMTDLVMTQNSFYHFYLRIEQIVKIKTIKFSVIILILLNWYWNIIKDL